MSVEPFAHVLAGRVALVTGASSGIGRAITIALVDAGASVIAVGRNRDRLAAVVGQAGTRIKPVVCDLTDADRVDQLVDLVTARSGSLDILIHSAGSIEFGAVADAGVDQLERLVRTNLLAPFQLTRTMLPLLAPSRGDIVFINSSAGIRPSPGVAAYGATKHALRGLADALRDEVNAVGIRVTTVYPGRTQTPMQESVYAWEGRDEPPRDLLDPADIATMVVSILALPRSAEVTDLHIRPARPPAKR